MSSKAKSKANASAKDLTKRERFFIEIFSALIASPNHTEDFSQKSAIAIHLADFNLGLLAETPFEKDVYRSFEGMGRDLEHELGLNE